MKTHRFYIGNTQLRSSVLIKDPRLIHQWTRVLRFQVNRKVSLFNDQKQERIYRIKEITKDAVRVEHVAEIESRLPDREVYLCFSLLKKDKNDWILQKATEIGASQFVPLVANRVEKTGFDRVRAEKIVIEAAEQCGRTDIPIIMEPMKVSEAIEKLSGIVDMYIAQEGISYSPSTNNPQPKSGVAVLVGPEGGWSDQEKKLFTSYNLRHIQLSKFTLRAETACIVAVSALTVRY